MTRLATNASEVELLIDVVRRSPLLEALHEETVDRATLQERLEISRSTSHRHTRFLDELEVIEKEDGEFQLTASGELLSDATRRFKREALSALQLAPVLETVQRAPADIDPEAFVGAAVTSAEKGDQYSPVARFLDLVRESDTLRGVDIDVIAPLYLDEIQRRIVGGMQTDAVCLPEVTENILRDYPERCLDACASGNLTVRLKRNLPFGLALFDRRVGVGVCNPDGRSLRVLVDTDAPAVYEWAEAVYETYRAEATPLEEYTQRGLREAMESMPNG